MSKMNPSENMNQLSVCNAVTSFGFHRIRLRGHGRDLERKNTFSFHRCVLVDVFFLFFLFKNSFHSLIKTSPVPTQVNVKKTIYT